MEASGQRISEDKSLGELNVHVSLTNDQVLSV